MLGDDDWLLHTIWHCGHFFHCHLLESCLRRAQSEDLKADFLGVRGDSALIWPLLDVVFNPSGTCKVCKQVWKIIVDNDNCIWHESPGVKLKYVEALSTSTWPYLFNNIYSNKMSLLEWTLLPHWDFNTTKKVNKVYYKVHLLFWRSQDSSKFFLIPHSAGTSWESKWSERAETPWARLLIIINSPQCIMVHYGGWS